MGVVKLYVLAEVKMPVHASGIVCIGVEKNRPTKVVGRNVETGLTVAVPFTALYASYPATSEGLTEANKALAAARGVAEAERRRVAAARAAYEHAKTARRANIRRICLGVKGDAAQGGGPFDANG